MAFDPQKRPTACSRRFEATAQNKTGLTRKQLLAQETQDTNRAHGVRYVPRILLQLKTTRRKRCLYKYRRQRLHAAGPPHLLQPASSTCPQHRHRAASPLARDLGRNTRGGPLRLPWRAQRHRRPPTPSLPVVGSGRHPRLSDFTWERSIDGGSLRKVVDAIPLLLRATAFVGYYNTCLTILWAEPMVHAIQCIY